MRECRVSGLLERSPSLSTPVPACNPPDPNHAPAPRSRRDSGYRVVTETSLDACLIPKRGDRYSRAVPAGGEKRQPT